MKKASLLLATAVLFLLCERSIGGDLAAGAAPAGPNRQTGGIWLAAGNEYAAADAASSKVGPSGGASATNPAAAPGAPPSMTAPTAAGATAATGGDRAYVPWPQRRGPAYPGNFWPSVGRDVKELPATVWDDTKAVFTDPVSLIGIGLAGVAGIAINASGADNSIARQTGREGNQLNHFWDSTFDAGGNPGTHFAVAGAMYLVSMAKGDTKSYEVSKTLINALAVNGVVTLALKAAVRTRSPNGDPWGWPSGHTSSSFAFATVMAQEYGPAAGVPLYAFATMVGFERIDARNHDFSDVVSGAMIGTVIGYVVDKHHKGRIMGMDVVPIVSTDGGIGVGLSKQW